MKRMVLQLLKKEIVKKAEKIEESENQEDKLLGSLNPRYFEEILTPKKALDKYYASKYPFSFNPNPFRL